MPPSPVTCYSFALCLPTAYPRVKSVFLRHLALIPPDCMPCTRLSLISSQNPPNSEVSAGKLWIIQRWVYAFSFNLCEEFVAYKGNSGVKSHFLYALLEMLHFKATNASHKSEGESTTSYMNGLKLLLEAHNALLGNERKHWTFQLDCVSELRGLSSSPLPSKSPAATAAEAGGRQQRQPIDGKTHFVFFLSSSSFPCLAPQMFW